MTSPGTAARRLDLRGGQGRVVGEAARAPEHPRSGTHPVPAGSPGSSSCVRARVPPEARRCRPPSASGSGPSAATPACSPAAPARPCDRRGQAPQCLALLLLALVLAPRGTGEARGPQGRARRGRRSRSRPPRGGPQVSIPAPGLGRGGRGSLRRLRAALGRGSLTVHREWRHCRYLALRERGHEIIRCTAAKT